MMLQHVEPLAQIRKVAVLRANLLGDFIFTLPALEALRVAYPAAEIVLLGRAWHAAFLQGRPAPVDRVIAIPPEWDSVHGIPEGLIPPVLQRLFESLSAERFDLAVQLHGGGRNANPFILRLGARHTIGLRAPDASPLDRWVPYIYYQHEILRGLEVVALVGARPAGLEPHITITDRDLAEVNSAVPDTGKSVIALHPGATDSRRHWPVVKFASVGDALAREGAHVIVTGTAGERHLVEGVVQTMRAPAQDLCDRLSIGGLAGLLSRCRVVVSNDSGPLHLAAAVGAATVGIYWCGNLINFGPLTRAAHRPAISWRLTCPECGVDATAVRCSHTSSFVADVPAEEVINSACDLFHSRSAPG